MPLCGRLSRGWTAARFRRTTLDAESTLSSCTRRKRQLRPSSLRARNSTRACSALNTAARGTASTACEKLTSISSGAPAFNTPSAIDTVAPRPGGGGGGGSAAGVVKAALPGSVMAPSGLPPLSSVPVPMYTFSVASAGRPAPLNFSWWLSLMLTWSSDSSLVKLPPTTRSLGSPVTRSITVCTAPSVTKIEPLPLLMAPANVRVTPSLVQAVSIGNTEGGIVVVGMAGFCCY